MQLVSFRIENFRSIVDSGWVPLSPDGITVFVGQNESGKSSVLEALYFALSFDMPTSDDFRIGAALPKVFIRIGIETFDIPVHFKEMKSHDAAGLKAYLAESNSVVEIECGWNNEVVEGKNVLVSYCEVTDSRLTELIDMAKRDGAAVTSEVASSGAPAEPPSLTPGAPASTAVSTVPNASSPASGDDDEDISVDLWRALPLSVLFNEESGRLPNQVDIDEKGQPTGSGAKAAQNFLQIADINLPELLKGDRRARENTLNKANSRVSQDFNTFWSQTIGKSGRLSLKCDIDNYSTGTPEKVGKPHLVFWICDGNTQLYPKQRSQGVRWFVSFYLQLKASEKAKNRRIFLLDEPGANLHSRAQGDVLKLINKLGKDTSTVIYSTHSPQMLEYPKLFRVHAVQRDGDQDESPSRIIDAHRLGTASTDTLSPILTAMGADLSQHQVVRKTNNILLEEMSGYYYLSSFWRMLQIKTEAHFIAATGVNKIEALANMFRGWGLDFIVAVDDDKQGREAYKSMKRELFGDDDALANKGLLKLPGCVGIEDIFSRDDFAKLVLKDDAVVISGTNSEFVKFSGRSKPVLAFHFAMAVDSGNIAWANLSSESQAKINEVVRALQARLN